MSATLKTFANLPDIRIHRSDEKEFEQVVFAEVLVPDTPNVYNDYWTREGIKHFAYEFMRRGFGIDIDHDNIDRNSPDLVYMVEAFIARDGDPVFIPGSWVVGMKIEDPVIWQDILDGKINGYSYEALVSFVSAILTLEDDGVRTGYTEPDPFDGHTHAFMVLVDTADNRPIEGGTSETNGHSHTIVGHTVTEEADGHTHRYNLVIGKDGK